MKELWYWENYTIQAISISYGRHWVPAKSGSDHLNAELLINRIRSCRSIWITTISRVSQNQLPFYEFKHSPMSLHRSYFERPSLHGLHPCKGLWSPPPPLQQCIIGENMIVHEPQMNCPGDTNDQACCTASEESRLLSMYLEPLMR